MLQECSFDAEKSKPGMRFWARSWERKDFEELSEIEDESLDFPLRSLVNV